MSEEQAVDDLSVGFDPADVPDPGWEAVSEWLLIWFVFIFGAVGVACLFALTAILEAGK